MKRIRAFLLPVFVLVLSQSSLHGQDSIRTGSWLTMDIHYGFILPLYTSSMNILIQGHVPAGEIDYVNKPVSENNWLGPYHCPETGIALFSAYLNNPAQLGNEYGVYPFVNFHLKRSFNEGLYLRVGIGLAYMPVKFNPAGNHKNDVIGSHLNTMFNMRLNYHFYLSDKIRLETGIGLTHCSNGNFQTPNLGINLVTANTGLSYCIAGEGKCVKKPFVDTTTAKKVENVFIITGGLSETEVSGREKFPNMTLSYIRFYRLNSKSKLGFGTDIIYNQADIAKLKADSVFLKNNLEITQLGIKAAYEITLGNLSLPLEMGAYLYTKYTGNGYFYNRIGLRYYAGKHIIVNLTLVTHFAEADFIEWGVGYRL